MACDTEQSFIANGQAQIAAAQLGADDARNALASLWCVNTFTVGTLWCRQVRPGLAYFTINPDGCPQLWTGAGVRVPLPPAPLPPSPPAATPPGGQTPSAAVGGGTGAPPSPSVAPAAAQASPPGDGGAPPPGAIELLPGQPCPPGWVPYPGGTPPPGGGGPGGPGPIPIVFPWPTGGGGVGPGSPTPLCPPSVGVVSQAAIYVTPDDCLAVTVTATLQAAGLVMVLRVLGCDGKVSYLQQSLPTVNPGAPVTFTSALGWGWLLDVCVSAPGATWGVGFVFVSISLQHTCAAGAPPYDQLAQGYVSGTYAVGWPTSPTGGPITPGTPLAGPGTAALLQHRAGTANSGTTVTVTFPLTVTAGSCLVALEGALHTAGIHTITDTQGNSWSRVITNGDTAVWLALNAKAGVTAVTLTTTQSTDAPISIHLMEITNVVSTSAVDVTAINSGGPPITATTPASGFVDIAVVNAVRRGGTGTTYTAQAGYTQVDVTSDTSGIRTTGFWTPASSASGTAFAFTFDEGGNLDYVTIVTLKLSSI